MWKWKAGDSSSLKLEAKLCRGGCCKGVFFYGQRNHCSPWLGGISTPEATSFRDSPKRYVGRGSRQPARISDPPAPTHAAASRTVGRYENCSSSHFTAPTLSPGQSRQFWPQSSPNFCLGKVPLSFPCKLLGPLCFLKPKTSIP